MPGSLLARLYTRRGLPDLALEHYRLGAALFPGSVVVTLELAKALQAAGETGQALRATQECLAKHPEGVWELLSLEGILEDDLGQWAQAETAHRAALALAPGHSALYNNLGYNLLLQGKAEAAAAEFRNAIKADPLSIIAHNNLGDALAKQARFREALAEWQLVDGPAVAHNNLAAALMAAGRYAEARAEIALALGFRHDFPGGVLEPEAGGGTGRSARHDIAGAEGAFVFGFKYLAGVLPPLLCYWVFWFVVAVGSVCRVWWLGGEG